MQGAAVLDKMKEEILSGAKARAEKIISEAKKEADELIKAAEEKAKKIEENILVEGKKEAETHKQRELGKIRLKSRMNILSKKEELINEVFNELWRRIVELSTDKDRYLPLLKEFIFEAALGLNGGELKVFLNERDSKVSESILEEIATEVEKKIGNKTNLQLANSTIKTQGGAIVETLDGRMLINNTFEARLERFRRNLRVDIANILFK